METNKVIEVIDVLAEKFGIVVDWTSENVTPYLEVLAEKYINYEIAISVTYLILGVGFIIIAFFSAKYCITIFKKDICDIDELPFTMVVLSGFVVAIFGIIGVIIIFAQVKDILTCIYFPELQIFEYLSSMMQ